MQHDRRTNPYPYTWEIPAAVMLVVLVVLVLAVHAGAAAANLLAGNGPHWIARDDWFTSLPGILAGDSTTWELNAAAWQAGVSYTDQEARDSTTGLHATHPAPRVLLWACLAVTELLAITGLTVGGVTARRYVGPGRIRGMASRREAANLLGPQRLHRVAAVVRPDLYGRRGQK